MLYWRAARFPVRVALKAVNYRQVRRFGRRIEDVPATMRHRVRGTPVILEALPNNVLLEAIREISVWITRLKEHKTDQNHIMASLSPGQALQGTMQALLMLDGLLGHASMVQKALGVINETKLHRSHEIETALDNLQPYYDGNNFIFDFDPPFYLLSQN
jgi:hypothetical protein